MITIAIDAMGGDQGPEVLVSAALDVFQQHPGLSLILVGDKAAIDPVVQGRQSLNSPADADSATEAGTVVIRHASEVIAMDDKPAVVLRTKKDASMRVAVDLLARGEADACVSAGNTGALMAISRFVLRTCEGIDRPAIISALPSRNGQAFMLDLGANVDCNSEQLYQFALMGQAVARALTDIEKPRVALLNIGEEDVKGNDQVKQANELLRADPGIHYIGYVEGNQILSGDVDVIVCDGFVGNVALKSIEGASSYLLGQLEDQLAQLGWKKYLFGWLLRPLLRHFLKRFHPAEYNGATLVGLRGIVVKSHGAADKAAFANAIELAVKEVHHNLPRQIMSL
ncbi:MAG: phosphate acyltransferase PlsX [Ketobacteraceae bacterium]|nr:phosphate acyltransferase PlsX [Ketobacteraceae bacterium]